MAFPDENELYSPVSTDVQYSSTLPEDESLLSLKSMKELAQRLSVAAGRLADKQQETDNWKPPALQKIPETNQYFYLTAPIRLKRRFSSPVALTGPLSIGPNRERLIAKGWEGKHTGLDYSGVYGEDVKACASGRVDFVGYMAIVNNRPIKVLGPKQNTQGDVLNVLGIVSAAKSTVGDGGIFVRITHDGDFSGYQTEYFHLSATSVIEGGRVEEGAVIGKMGNTGNVTTPQLHLSVSYFNGGRAVAVNPSTLVPNYFPGHTDTTTTEDELLRANYINPGPGGQRLVTGLAASFLRTIDRSTDIQNIDRKKLTAAQTEHTAYITQTIGQQQAQVYEAAAKFQQAGIIVIDAMTFDFDNGYWVDGTGQKRPV
jgi:murein DD-endopeptidase MepM/ murein hydrolase activator NlpD